MKVLGVSYTTVRILQNWVPCSHTGLSEPEGWGPAQIWQITYITLSQQGEGDYAHQISDLPTALYWASLR